MNTTGQEGYPAHRSEPAPPASPPRPAGQDCSLASMGRRRHLADPYAHGQLGAGAGRTARPRSGPLVASAPASVTIPAGSSSATFPITTQPVPSSTLVSFAATSTGRS